MDLQFISVYNKVRTHCILQLAAAEVEADWALEEGFPAWEVSLLSPRTTI